MADVIAHHNTYGRLLQGWEGEGQPRKGDGLPQITFDSEMDFHLGGVEIELFHIGRGHTDTDVAVWIASENVVHMGDLFFNGMAPYVDKANGAYLLGWSEFISTVLLGVSSSALSCSASAPTPRSSLDTASSATWPACATWDATCGGCGN